MKTSVMILTAAASVAAWAGVGLQEIDDVRVDALVSSHWGQRTNTGYNNDGGPCFNYYTPNGYPCGCNATLLAQIFRYWKYPASLPAGRSLCMVDGAQQSLDFGGHAYDYDAMPAITGDADDNSCRAIGELTYDCAVSLHSMFGAGSTSAFGMYAFAQLREVFGYANAVGYVPESSLKSFGGIEKTIVANLDAGCPVALSMRSSATGYGHQALVDGYGYHGGELYFHFNLGWCNVQGDDAWYRLGEAIGFAGDSTFVYDEIDGVVYNIFPGETGDVLSGRVCYVNGAPAAGVTVTAQDGKAAPVSATTDKNGIYAFVLPGGKTYTVTCRGEKKTVALAESVSAKRMITTKKEGDIWENPFAPRVTNGYGGSVGGSSGNDFTVSDHEDPLPCEHQWGEWTVTKAAEVGVEGSEQRVCALCNEVEIRAIPALDPPQPVGAFGPFYPAKAFNAVYPFTGVVVNPSELPIGIIQLKVGKPSKKGVSKVSGTIKMADGKSYSIKAVNVNVDADASVTVRGITVSKLGTMDLEIGNEGFAAKINASEIDLFATTMDLSVGLKPGTATFSVEGLPEEISGKPVLARLLPVNEEITVTAKKWTVPGKATSVKYVKIPKTKPAEYELLIDDDKGKTNRSALKLTYTAKTASFKGSFTVYSDDGGKHKIIKNSFTVTGIVVNGMAVGIATCKKAKLSVPVAIAQ